MRLTHLFIFKSVSSDFKYKTILTNSDWLNFKNYFQSNHPGYINNLRNTFPKLSDAEERLFLLIKLNHNTKEISAILGITIESVKKTRNRLRKRLNLTEELDLDTLALLFPSDSTTVLAHGYRPPERMLSATSTAGNRISMIDWRPAFEVYQEIIKEEYGIELTADNFYQYGVHYPFGMLRANSEVIVRMPVAIAEDGSLFCIGEVPENAILVLLKSPAPDENGCIQGLAKTLEVEYGGLLGRRLLSFYCAGRRMHLGDGAELELAILAKASAVEELAGAVSLGEIGCTQLDGYPMFHNATLVCTAWGAK